MVVALKIKYCPMFVEWILQRVFLVLIIQGGGMGGSLTGDHKMTAALVSSGQGVGSKDAGPTLEH